MVKGIIFDFDGVISDTEPFYTVSIIRYLKGLGYEESKDDCEKLCGVTAMYTAEHYKAKYNIPFSVEKIKEDMDVVFNTTTDFNSFVPMKGLIDFIDKAKSKGIRMCIASSSCYEYLERNLKFFNIFDYFEFIVSGEDLNKSKPDPYIYNHTAEKLGIPKDELIIIEDSKNGIAAGKASGIKTYGLKASKIMQDTSNADVEVDSFDEIEI